MKKFFTLIAVALMAASAYAQDSYVIKKEFVPTDGQTIEAGSVTLTYGAADGAAGWKASGLSESSSLREKGYEAGVTGNVNPVDADGIGRNKGGALPVKGVYYVFKSSQAGSIELAAKIGGDKPFYIIDSDNTEYGPSSIVNESGEAITLTDNKWSDGGNCLVTFAVEANKSYYVFCAGSKLTIYGFLFTAGEGAGIKAVKAEKAGIAYNLAGQKVGAGYKGLVIKNGRKYMK